MTNSRTEKFLLAGLTLLFACISWHFTSQNYKLGSYEARQFLSRRPVIIEWERLKSGEPLVLEKLVGQDTFINFSATNNFELVDDPTGLPSLYLKNSNKILYPIFMETKNGGLPPFLIRELSRFTSPQFALVFFVWLTGLLALVVSIIFVRRTTSLALPFTILACLSPQFILYAYSDYPDTTLSLLLVLVILLTLHVAGNRRAFFLTGVLAGFTLYVKLAAIFFAPAILMFYWEKIKKNFLPIFFGSLPFLVFIMATMNDSLRGHIESRAGAKNFDSFLNAFKHFFIDIFSPEIGLLFRILNGQKRIETVLFEYPIYLPTLILGFACIGYLAWKYMSRTALVKLSLFAVLYIVLITMISFGLDRDFYVYTAMGAYFLTVLFVTNLNPTWSRKIGLIFFITLIILKLIVLMNWKTQYDVTKRSFNGCIWIYDCMVKDWEKNNLIGNHPLITLYFLDVGQIEFFSEERIIPFHLASSFTQDPTEEQFHYFLKNFKHKEFRILSGGSTSGKRQNLSSYLNIEKLESLGLQIDVLNTYDYPDQRKRYQLVRVVRK